MGTLGANLRSSIPGISQVPSVLLLLAGAWVGWLLHPVIWLAWGPFRWAAAVLGIAAQESGFNASAYNDEGGHRNGGSQGLMQFQEATWIGLTGRDLEDRTSSFWSGFYAAKYVQNGFLADWRWWLTALPIVGFAGLRAMWYRGNSSSAADFFWSDVAERLSTENRSLVAFLLWRTVSLWPAAAVVLAVSRLRRKGGR